VEIPGNKASPTQKNAKILPGIFTFYWVGEALLLGIFTFYCVGEALLPGIFTFYWVRETLLPGQANQFM
jgi:hypothetical protein